MTGSEIGATDWTSEWLGHSKLKIGRTSAAIITATILSILFVWLVRFGSSMVATAEEIDIVDLSEVYVGRLDAAMGLVQSSVDQIVTSLTATSFGTFVLLGFNARSNAKRVQKYDLWDGAAALALVCCTFVSLYFAYETRTQSLVLTAKILPDAAAATDVVNALSSNAARQAFWVGLGSIFAFFLLVRSFLTDEPTPMSGGNSGPADTMEPDELPVSGREDIAVVVASPPTHTSRPRKVRSAKLQKG